MAVVFLFCLIYMPLHASYHFLLGEVFLFFYNMLTVLCMVDIVMNFVSGRCISQEEILMEPKKIAECVFEVRIVVMKQFLLGRM